MIKNKQSNLVKFKFIFILLICLLTVFSVDHKLYSAPPFLDFEGVGGGGIVPGAYLVNPPKDNEKIGKPAFAQWNLIGENNNVYTFCTAKSAKTPLFPVELGYALEINDFRRLRHELKRDSNGKLDVEEPMIYMSNFHLKALLIDEKKFVPAFSIAAECKVNHTIEEINENIDNRLDKVGYDNNLGIDFDLLFSKTINLFYFPCIIHTNIRFTRAHYLGLLGFSNDYTANGEFSISFLPLPKIGFGFEYRQQNDEFDKLPLKGYSMEEDPFWDINISVFPNDKLSMAFALCRYGNVVNQGIDFFVFNIKYDF